jgi:WD repeat-containing protein 21A
MEHSSFLPLQPHAITPSQDYFFAAGLDNRIRGWSLLTGEPLSHPHPTLEVPSNQVDMEASPFGVKFEGQITSLEIIEAGRELWLYATSGLVLHRFILGRRFSYET